MACPSRLRIRCSFHWAVCDQGAAGRAVRGGLEVVGAEGNAGRRDHVDVDDGRAMLDLHLAFRGIVLGRGGVVVGEGAQVDLVALAEFPDRAGERAFE